MITGSATMRRGRAIHVIIDSASIRKGLRQLPANPILTGPATPATPRSGSPPPSRTSRRVCVGDGAAARTRGAKIGTVGELADATDAETVAVTR